MSPESTGRLLVQVLRKIPIFKDLSPQQVKKILGICAHRPYKAGKKICKSNTASDEMFVLISGELAVVTAEGVRVATILPVAMVGEMGVITGQRRSATVEAAKPSNIFAIAKPQFDQVIRDDIDMGAKIYRNIIGELSAKLNNDNVRLRDYQIEQSRYQERIVALERQLDEQEGYVEGAMELAVEKGEIGRDEIEFYLEDKLKDMVPSILVVDDEDDFRHLVKQALPAFAVLEAEDGQQALDVVQEERLDLVITDIRMPGMDGLGLLANLRSQFPDLPVLAISGYLDAEELQEYDFDGFIEKPVNLEQLQILVEETIAQTKQ